MAAFNVTPKKHPVDPALLASFAGGADTRAPKTVTPPPPSPPVVSRATESLLFRLSPEDLAEFNFVFENTNIKSKQKLLEAIILTEIRSRAAALRSQVK